MPKRFVCPVGHEWEVPSEQALAKESLPCPVCGQDTQALMAATVDFPGDAAVTLPPETPAPSGDSAAVTDPGPTWPKLSGYEILQELGRGGMGVVYLARQASLHRLVALKMIQGGTGVSDHDRGRFRMEAEAVARFQHPNIVQIFEVGEQEGRPFVALEYVDGGPLSHKLRQGPLESRAAARIVELLARAMHHAHQRGILHRDLKPGNVLLTADGTPKITDFGLAKPLQGPGITQTGQAILGTPSYMAPEQAQGKSEKLGPAVDIYALGATLYELLTGRPPFREPTPLDTVLKLISEDPPRPSHWRPNLPRDVETICLKCLAKLPSQRYASAEALADDLHRFLEGEPIQARPPGTFERAFRWLKRRREKVALAIGGLALVGFFVVALWPSPDPKDVPLAADNTPKPEPPLELPADLALIPRDGFGFVTVKVSEILAREDFVQLYQQIAKAMPADPPPSLEQLSDDSEKELGVRLRDITRLTQVFYQSSGAGLPKEPQKPLAGLGWFLEKGDSSLAIVTTVKPYDRSKIQGLFAGPVQVKKHQDKEYLLFPDPKAPTICFLTDQVFALSMDEQRMRQFLEQIPSANARGPLVEALQLASYHPFVIGLHPSGNQPKEWADGFGGFLKVIEKGLLRPDPFELAPKVHSFLDADSLTFTLNWTLRIGTVDSLKLGVHVTYADETRANKGFEATNLLRRKLANLLKEMDEKLTELAKVNPEVLLGAGQFGLIQMRELRIALQEADPQIQGKKMQVQLRMRFDLAGYFEALGKQLAQFQARMSLSQLAGAMKAYHDKHGRLPPAAVYGPDGKPLHSWRVELLPFLNEQELYDEFKRDEPWDSAHNKKLLAKMPRVFKPARGEAKEPHATFYQVFVGPGAAFEGKQGLSFKDFTDGLDNTLLIVEAAEAVPWTKPGDLTFTPKRPLPKLGATAQDEVGVARADGFAVTLSRKLSEKTLPALITRNGKEPIDWESMLFDEMEKQMFKGTIAVKGAAQRTETLNNLCQLAKAMHLFHDKHRRFPFAAVHSPDGKPLYSWRVELLPFLDEQKLYDEFKRDEPWDSPHNKKLLAKMPAVFKPARGEAKDPHATFYQVFVGPGTAFDGQLKLNLIGGFPDGTSNTLLIVEAAEAVPWTKPADLTFTPKQPLPKLGATARDEVVVVRADGSGVTLSRKLSEKTMRALITRNGGEPIDWDKVFAGEN